MMSLLLCHNGVEYSWDVSSWMAQDFSAAAFVSRSIWA